MRFICDACLCFCAVDLSINSDGFENIIWEGVKAFQLDLIPVDSDSMQQDNLSDVQDLMKVLKLISKFTVRKM